MITDASNLSSVRLIDRLKLMPKFELIHSSYFEEKQYLIEEGLLRTEESLRASICQAEIFEITNISELVRNDTSLLHTGAKDLVCVMPPFDDLWMEYLERTKPGVYSRLGALIECYEPEPEDKQLTPELWCNLEFHLFAESALGRPVRTVSGPVAVFSFGIDASGRILHGNNVHMRQGLGLDSSSLSVKLEEIPAIIPFLLALQFINCRNTVIINRQADRSLNAHHERKHKSPLVVFKTLEISQVKQISEEINPSKELVDRALHVCRGHFKDYRRRGLFGRNKGLYWWGSQVRGSSDRGVVLKDYAVADRTAPSSIEDPELGGD